MSAVTPKGVQLLRTILKGGGILVGGDQDDTRVSRKLRTDGYITIVDYKSGTLFWTLTEDGRRVMGCGTGRS